MFHDARAKLLNAQQSGVCLLPLLTVVSPRSFYRCKIKILYIKKEIDMQESTQQALPVCLHCLSACLACLLTLPVCLHCLSACIAYLLALPACLHCLSAYIACLPGLPVCLHDICCDKDQHTCRSASVKASWGSTWTPWMSIWISSSCRSCLGK